jgi:lipoyl-dependent peroxiredoxin subunit D
MEPATVTDTTVNGATAASATAASTSPSSSPSPSLSTSPSTSPSSSPESRATDALERVRAALPDYARDLRLNLSTVLTPEGAPGLSESQIWSVAVAAAIAARNPGLARALEAAAGERLDAAHLLAARTAAAIMGMNNVYYRFVHLVEDPIYRSLPARLRMNALGSPPAGKIDFELLSLAVSAVNGCGMCVSAHERALRERSLVPEAIQSAVRIAAVINAVGVVLEYESA